MVCVAGAETRVPEGALRGIVNCCSEETKVLGLALLYLGANRNLRVHEMEKYTRSEAIRLIKSKMLTNVLIY